jgi:hypothetical protein
VSAQVLRRATSSTSSHATWDDRFFAERDDRSFKGQDASPVEVIDCGVPDGWWSLDRRLAKGLGEVDLGGCLQFGRKRFFRFEQTLIAPGLSQKLLAFRTRLIFFGRLKFSDDDLVQLVDGPMRYGFPAHGPIETLILVLDQSTLVPYFYGFDQCFLRVRSFGITNWLVRSA